MIRKLADIELQDKTVFLRVDFNVPIDQGRIAETHRIDSALPTVRSILQRAKTVVIASPGRPDGKVVPKYSLAPWRDYLEKALQQAVVMVPDCIGPEVERIVRDEKHRIVLAGNLRFHKEKKRRRGFARALASLAQAYVNDASARRTGPRFHLRHGGLFQIKAAGLLLQKELDYLSPILAQPAKPFVTILGGAKVSDKIGVIRNLLSKVNALLIGGGMAYTFLKAAGQQIGRSLVEQDKLNLASDLLKEAATHGVEIFLPVDHVTGDADKKNPATCDEQIPPDRMGLDIGPKTAARFAEEIKKAKMVLGTDR